MQIPPDQYLRAMQQLAVTFTTRPVLSDQLSLRLPLPVEAGFSWAWVAPGAAPAALTPLGAPDVPSYGLQPAAAARGLARPDPRTPPSTNGSQQ